jgi:poly [ADP-ribose] polymerase
MQASHAARNARATKGVGVTQHPNWQDAGLALGHKELEGVYMPKGEASRVDPPGGAFLMYNEVRDRDKMFSR